ncbi:hypothetical protein AZ78_1512 [Lysobacter capsici AZ78]|uniref:Uncharacterized protein n=1 Tax=Lysobacter capsici AZ78 TaxID=1444315 RepID=A0A120AG34_9GAMM|nr:hypothetical protein AZ78_1512 [Lysobacter capsici AZ78]
MAAIVNSRSGCAVVKWGFGVPSRVAIFRPQADALSGLGIAGPVGPAQQGDHGEQGRRHRPAVVVIGSFAATRRDESRRFVSICWTTWVPYRRPSTPTHGRRHFGYSPRSARLCAAGGRHKRAGFSGADNDEARPPRTKPRERSFDTPFSRKREKVARRAG